MNSNKTAVCYVCGTATGWKSGDGIYRCLACIDKMTVEVVSNDAHYAHYLFDVLASGGNIDACNRVKMTESKTAECDGGIDQVLFKNEATNLTDPKARAALAEEAAQPEDPDV